MKYPGQALYIWTASFDAGSDNYRLFRKEFELKDKSAAILEIAADTTFTVYINGKRCPVSQLADFPAEPTFSAFDATDFLVSGKNVIAVEVHYVGADFLTCQTGTPFLRCLLYSAEGVIVKSDESWKCADSAAYSSGMRCKVTNQLGFVFQYDAGKAVPYQSPGFDDSSWRNARAYTGGLPWKQMTLRKIPQLQEQPRPDVAIAQCGYLFREKEYGTFAESCFHDYLVTCRDADFTPDDSKELFQRKRRFIPAAGTTPFVFNPIPQGSAANGYYITLDLGKERVGFLDLKFSASAGTVVDICHGEHLDDGRVRSYVGFRNFADRCICKEGLNEFTFTHRRFGCRYIELHITHTTAFTLYYAGLIPLELPLPSQAEFQSEDHFLTRLNQLSIDTLKLCMHEHYEDCPWREQGLYAYDSRNQIMYGYYVWGNYDFAGACIDLLGKSFDGKRYLALTAPGKAGRPIPVFTLVWISELYEHWLYSGSPALFEKWCGVADTILDRALAEREPGGSGLYHPGTAAERIWNYCEWNGILGEVKEFPQSPYNIYLYEALQTAAEMHTLSGNFARAEALRTAAAKLGEAVEKFFWDEENGCYNVLAAGKNSEVYEHVQMLMLANELVPAEKQERLIAQLAEGKFCKADLSALYYVTRALLRSSAGSRKLLMAYMRGIFEPIVYSNSTSLWETRQGSDDFDFAGSLCHAWSSVMPCICGKVLLGVTPLEPGFKRFAVQIMPGDLTHAAGEIPTPAGKIRVEWKLEETGLHVKVAHPVGTEPIPEAFEEFPVVSFETSGINGMDGE